MIGNLVSEFLGSTRRIGIFVLVLVGVAYGAGFLIFNIYLGRLGAVSFEIVHTRFLSTGILYLFIQSLAVLTAIASVSPVLYALDQLHDLRQREEIDAGLADEASRSEQLLIQKLTERLVARGIQEDRAKRRTSVLFLMVSIASFVVLFTLFEMGAASITAQLLAWTTRGVVGLADLWLSVSMMNVVQGASAILVFVVATEMRSRLHLRLALPVTMLALACALMVQVYLLLAYTAQVYPLLPPTVGGGRPYAVRIVTAADAALTRLGIPMQEGHALWEAEQGDVLPSEPAGEEFGVDSRKEQQGVLENGVSVQVTEWVTLLDERPSSYLIAPCLPQDLAVGCPTVQVDTELVLGLIYWPQLQLLGSGTQP